jgi:hypothetical protein
MYRDLHPPTVAGFQLALGPRESPGPRDASAIVIDIAPSVHIARQNVIPKIARKIKRSFPAAPETPFPFINILPSNHYLRPPKLSCSFVTCSLLYVITPSFAGRVARSAALDF